MSSATLLTKMAALAYASVATISILLWGEVLSELGTHGLSNRYSECLDSNVPFAAYIISKVSCDPTKQ